MGPVTRCTCQASVIAFHQKAGHAGGTVLGESILVDAIRGLPALSIRSGILLPQF